MVWEDEQGAEADGVPGRAVDSCSVLGIVPDYAAVLLVLCVSEESGTDNLVPHRATELRNSVAHDGRSLAIIDYR